MKKYLALFGLLGLGGCAEISALTTGGLTTTQVYVAANSFDAAELTATNYLKLPPCGTGVCRNPKATATLVSTIRSGYQARQALLADCAASTTAPTCVSSYTAVTTAIGTLQSIFTQYSISKGS